MTNFWQSIKSFSTLCQPLHTQYLTRKQGNCEPRLEKPGCRARRLTSSLEGSSTASASSSSSAEAACAAVGARRRLFASAKDILQQTPLKGATANDILDEKSVVSMHPVRLALNHQNVFINFQIRAVCTMPNAANEQLAAHPALPDTPFELSFGDLI